MPDAAIIIPHYNDVTRLLRCLQALQPQLSARVEVVVIDNSSTDDLDVVRDAFPNLRLITEPQAGAAQARNRGVAETTAPRLFFIDADCVPTSNWIETALAATDQSAGPYANADVIGGAVDVFYETPAPRSGAEAFEAVFAFDNRSYVETKNFSVTANLLTRRDVFEATGPFDGSRSEDVDWCRRAIAKGYKLAYVDALKVSHPSRADWPALRKKWKRMTHESFGMNGVHFRARIKWALRAALMPVSAFFHAAKVIRHPDLNGPSERWAALYTLARLRLLRMTWMMDQAIRGRSAGR
tara:strand:+ start:72560 stop:73450 length:891 start_codon:yes stop_codon:yes gene_type:complete